MTSRLAPRSTLPEHVDRGVEERALERPAAVLPASRHLLHPAVGLVREQPEGMRGRRGAGQSLEEPGHDRDLVGALLGEQTAGHAALEEERPPFVVAREQAHGAPSVPAGERVRLVVGLEMRRRVELQDGAAGRHDERAGRVVGLLELEIPLGGALGREPRQPLEPFALVWPLLAESLSGSALVVG